MSKRKGETKEGRGRNLTQGGEGERLKRKTKGELNKKEMT